jgi:protein-S-isoprenylcysteine O-methyltransferase Ste14
VPQSVRVSLIVLSVAFVSVGIYFRLQSSRGGERLDRTREGWPILIGIRLAGFLTTGSIALWLWQPSRFEWAAVDMPLPFRWLGVIGFACAVVWLIWMFYSLGRNLTDTVVARRDSYFVDYGPYSLVRNPMYVGVLMLGLSLGLALGTWLVPLATIVLFALLALRTRTEERYLIERFGEQYRDYMTRVARFIPKWRSFRPRPS